LPEGAAKQTIETMCVGCHDLRRVVHSNYSPDEWHNVVNMMVSAGAPLSPAQKEAVTDYLVANFPRQTEGSRHHRGPGGRLIPRMASADAGLAAARSAGDA